jgi:hypothetical protein
MGKLRFTIKNLKSFVSDIRHQNPAFLESFLVKMGLMVLKKPHPSCLEQIFHRGFLSNN